MAGDFRSRARSVRQETRAHLAALRAARRGRRGDTKTLSAATETAAASSAHVDPTEFLPDISTDLAANIDMAQAPAEPVEALAGDPIEDGGVETADITAPVDASAPETPATEDAPAPVATLSEPVSESGGVDTPETLIEDLDEAPVVAPAPVTSTADLAASLADAPATSDSDLRELPGIGPGLIWFFEQRGIKSLTDLAAADAEQLRRDIGFIGSLIDFDGWIAFAQSRSA